MLILDWTRTACATSSFARTELSARASSPLLQATEHVKPSCKVVSQQVSAHNVAHS